MTHNKRAKNSRQRGSWTHGWGAKKKHRGAGHRGGRGNAGTGKRGDAKKPRYWKDTKYFGKHGFTSINPEEIITINLNQLINIIPQLIQKGHATQEKDTININLTQAGYDKLLGTGKIQQKLNITVQHASEKAQQKITEAKGTINTETKTTKTTEIKKNK